MWQLIKDILLTIARFFVKKEQPQPQVSEQETQEVQDAVAGKTDDEVEAVDSMSDRERLDAAVAAGIVRPDGAGGTGKPFRAGREFWEPAPVRKTARTKRPSDSEPDS